MYPYKLTKPSLLWVPPSSCVLPKLVNKPPSVHPLQDFPFVVISAGGEGRASGCHSEFNARPFEGNTGHKHLRGCHVNTPQVWQRVRKWMAGMNSSRSGATQEISSFCPLLNFLENMHLCDLLSVRSSDLQASSGGGGAGVEVSEADEGLNALLSLPCCFFVALSPHSVTSSPAFVERMTAALLLRRQARVVSLVESRITTFNRKGSNESFATATPLLLLPAVSGSDLFRDSIRLQIPHTEKK